MLKHCMAHGWQKIWIQTFYSSYSKYTMTTSLLVHKNQASKIYLVTYHHTANCRAVVSSTTNASMIMIIAINNWLASFMHMYIVMWNTTLIDADVAYFIPWTYIIKWKEWPVPVYIYALFSLPVAFMDTSWHACFTDTRLICAVLIPTVIIDDCHFLHKCTRPLLPVEI